MENITPVEAPPRPKRGGAQPAATFWHGVADTCRENAGVWYKVDHLVHRATPWRVVNGRIAAFVEGDWEATIREVGEVETDKGVMYLRFLGEGDRG